MASRSTRIRVKRRRVLHSRSHGLSLEQHNLSSISATESIASRRTRSRNQFTVISTQRGAGNTLGVGRSPLLSNSCLTSQTTSSSSHPPQREHDWNRPLANHTILRKQSLLSTPLRRPWSSGGLDTRGWINGRSTRPSLPSCLLRQILANYLLRPRPPVKRICFYPRNSEREDASFIEGDAS